MPWAQGRPLRTLETAEWANTTIAKWCDGMRDRQAQPGRRGPRRGLARCQPLADTPAA